MATSSTVVTTTTAISLPISSSFSSLPLFTRQLSSESAKRGDINQSTTPEVPPPLVLQDKTYFPSLERHLHTLRLKKDFTAKAQGRRVIIQAGSQRDYQKIRAAVEERKLGFHSYPNRAPEDRLKRFVARNLIFSTSLEDIKNDLASKNIHPNQILWKRKGGKLLPLLVIEVANKYAKAVQDMKTICHQIVTVEKKYKSGPPICSRCCSYNHLGRDCQNTYRCMSCLGGHGPEDPCPSKDKPVCRNCHQEGHRAVYKGCKQYRKYTGQEEDASSTSSSSSSSSSSARPVASGPKTRPPPKKAWQNVAPQQDTSKQDRAPPSKQAASSSKVGPEHPAAKAASSRAGSSRTPAPEQRDPEAPVEITVATVFAFIKRVIAIFTIFKQRGLEAALVALQEWASTW
ncbi:hypothetical protein ONE63_011154 [Megalurothrips usitatus]|uniref:Nucleic-acid-binding protein from transposon X-element n=1 Tax=Megalurothrips usitatus TaxID=439358 RepID=A0AAV7XF66_9NEOP|nr:hypothetical protein ONE63_011154 [Megalurothrips usitatus]